MNNKSIVVKKKVTTKEGITLIGLVITIVVMLILAGVTINLTLGQNGIFTTAQRATQNYTEAENQEMEQIDTFTSIVDKAVESIKNNYEISGTVLRTEGNIKYTADGAGNEIPVPVGFSPISSSSQGTKHTGFVIKNDTDGNEFVWVPVEGMSYQYERVAWKNEKWNTEQGTNGIDETTSSIKITRKDKNIDNYYWIEAMSEDEKNSVAIYGGYYIGRYEAGIVNYDEQKTKTSNSDITDPTEKENWTGYEAATGKNLKVVVQANKQVWNYITINKAKTLSEGLYNPMDNNVTSKLCSSYAWDTALKFIETKDNIYPTNSNVGNYLKKTGELQKTGYHSVNNIYDMGGNVNEWTTEITFWGGVYNYGPRGGSYANLGDQNPAAVRYCASEDVAVIERGFRITLFM